MSYDAYMVINTGGEYPATVYEIGNMTSNCREMWDTACELEFPLLDGRTGAELIPLLEKAVAHIKNPANFAAYKAMEPENGWGSRKSAAEYLQAILDACYQHPKALLHLSH